MWMLPKSSYLAIDPEFLKSYKWIKEYGFFNMNLGD